MIVAAIGLGVSQAALAADMPAKAFALKTAAYNWSGFYAGGNVGYGWGSGASPNLSLVDTTGVGLTGFFNAGGFPIGAVNPSGAIGGAQVGYNWQTSTTVYGLVADFQASDMHKQGAFASVAPVPPNLVATTTLDRRIDWFGTVRGKFGYAMQNWLAYGTGGLAFGHIRESLNFTSSGAPTGSGSNTQTKFGWALGAGLEYGWDKWSVGVEYLYIDLGRTNTTMPFAGYFGAASDSLTVSSQNSVNIVRALVNYRF